MAVQISYATTVRDFKGRFERSNWFRTRIPTEEYFIATPQNNSEDGWDIDDNVITTVSVWSDDAEKVATEFWFKFP